MDKGKEAGWRIKPPGAYARQQRAVDAGPPEPQWPTTMMAVGILLFIVLFWTIGQLTLITFTELFRWLALFAFAGNLLPQRWYAKRFGMDRMEWFWFNLLAVGPLLLSCCLLLNFFVHGPEQRMLVRVGQGFDLPAYWREHGELPPHLPWPNDFGTNPDKDRIALSTASVDDKVYGLAEGLFGYLVITREEGVWELLPEHGQLPAEVDLLLHFKRESFSQRTRFAEHRSLYAELDGAVEGRGQQEGKQTGLPIGEGGMQGDGVRAGAIGGQHDRAVQGGFPHGDIVDVQVHVGVHHVDAKIVRIVHLRSDGRGKAPGIEPGEFRVPHADQLHLAVAHASGDQGDGEERCELAGLQHWDGGLWSQRRGEERIRSRPGPSRIAFPLLHFSAPLRLRGPHQVLTLLHSSP
jgi:hypothetical protein